MLKEFRDFILTGNLLEFAVAVILAGAVSLVINGFVTDMVMPIIGELTGGIDLASKKHVLSPAIGVEGDENYKPENAIRYGAWIGTIINLIIVGFILFLMVKAYNKFNKKEEEAVGATAEELLTEIRDLLKKD